MAKGRATQAGMTRRAVLVVGGATLLAGYSQDPAGGSPTRRGPMASPDARSRARHGQTPDTGAPPRQSAGDLPMYHVDDGRKVIALTIDDGPSPVYTPQILRLLEQYQVTATFSMVGFEVAAHRGMAREVAAVAI